MKTEKVAGKFQFQCFVFCADSRRAIPKLWLSVPLSFAEYTSSSGLPSLAKFILQPLSSPVIPVILQGVDVGYLEQNHQKVPVKMQIPGPNPNLLNQNPREQARGMHIFTSSPDDFLYTSEVENYCWKHLSISKISPNLLDSQVV